MRGRSPTAAALRCFLFCFSLKVFNNCLTQKEISFAIKASSEGIRLLQK
jgi:hypothetical protein